MPDRSAVIRLISRFPGECRECRESDALAAIATRKADPRKLGRSVFSTKAATPPNSFSGCLSLLARRSRARFPTEPEILNALRQIDSIYPSEAHWLWKWKFRLADRQVRFNPDKYGWPWVAGTVSWVAPTAMVILAMRAWNYQSPRIKLAQEMLLDRACPSGGWNAGNSVVFGVNLDPQPDFTAMALLALVDTLDADAPVIGSARQYLAIRLRGCRSAYSLAWATMALAAWRDPNAFVLRGQLEALPLNPNAPTRVLALTALALEEPTFTFREFD